MKTLLKLFLFSLMIIAVGCNNEKKVEKFSTEKPYCIEIKKERSYFQAKKIADRLNEMGIEAYIVQKSDSSDGQWYSILSGAIEKVDSVNKYKQMIEKKFKLTDLNMVNYDSLKSFKIANEGDNNVIKESKKITALKPDVPEEIIDIIKKYPDNNALYLEKINVLNFANDKKEKVVLIAENMNLDLPRGITVSSIAKKCVALAKVIYKDNLYGDNITLSIMRLKDSTSKVSEASFLPAIELKHLDIAKEFASLILDTDKYLSEEMKEISIQAYVNLYGYKVTIEHKKDKFRTYYILVDEKFKFLYFSQSTDKPDKQMIKLLSMIGNSNGLNDYDEFYNSFYVLPEKNINQDTFLGFEVDKLTWAYAKQKGYVKWSKEMVGHWVASGYFNNSEKGLWFFNIFDLLTDAKQKYIYGSLYTTDKIEGKKDLNIYGSKGCAVYTNFNWNTYKAEPTLSEINFGLGRYVYAISPSSGDYNEMDLKLRAEAMQFVSGGYKIASNRK